MKAGPVEGGKSLKSLSNVHFPFFMKEWMTLKYRERHLLHEAV